LEFWIKFWNYEEMCFVYVYGTGILEFSDGLEKLLKNTTVLGVSGQWFWGKIGKNVVHFINKVFLMSSLERVGGATSRAL